MHKIIKRGIDKKEDILELLSHIDGVIISIDEYYGDSKGHGSISLDFNQVHELISFLQDSILEAED